MAAKPLSTTRRALLGAAASLPVLAFPTSARPARNRGTPPAADQAEWNARLTRYRHLAARAEAAAETGWFRAANDRYAAECANPATDRTAAFARLDRAEDLYWRRCTAPMQEAAVALVLTRAPDLEAVRLKLTAFRAHHLHELESNPRDCFDVIEEDISSMCWPTALARRKDRTKLTLQRMRLPMI